MLMQRERLPVPAGLLPAPAHLPSLQTAFSRRAAIFGAAASTGLLAGSAARSVGALKSEETPTPSAGADNRLAAMAAEICDVLDGAAYAFDEVHDEEDVNRRGILTPM